MRQSVLQYSLLWIWFGRLDCCGVQNHNHMFRELLLNNSKHILGVHIKHYWYFQGVTLKQYYTLFQTSNNIDIFRELQTNNTANFSRFRIIIKQHRYLQNYWQIILHTFSEFISWLIQSSYETIFTLSQSYY